MIADAGVVGDDLCRVTVKDVESLWNGVEYYRRGAARNGPVERECDAAKFGVLSQL